MTVPGRVSVVIPSREERFLPETVRDLRAKARGDVEIIVVADGYYADTGAENFLHFGEARGMRPAINHAIAGKATGEFILKCDAHTLWDEGYDLKLKADYLEDNWVVVPRRYALDPEKWAIDPSNRKYPIDYHYLSYPWERPDDPTCGMHGTPWTARREARKDVMLDDEMSSQGSAWFMSRKHWDRIGPLDVDSYGSFIQEMQEIGLKTWLGGGALKVTKNTWYGHWYKGKRLGGRGYSLAGSNHQQGAAFCIDYWMHDRWPERVHNLRWLIEKFSPVPGWPADLDEAFRPRLGESARRFDKSAPDGVPPIGILPETVTA